MAVDRVAMYTEIDEKEYQRRVNAWAMYDWANSAFATTILAAVLPIYFSQVAGTTLPSAAVATAYWSFGLSISLLIIAVISPILGTISDIMRGKKRFLAIFAGIGILGTALLVFVGTGDWILASILAIIGRIGFNGSITFYDALLPHVAKVDDRDRVSARGYALGYLGGGLLLAINVVMIQLLPGTWGARLSFLSVAFWWAIFSIPLFRRVPEPPAATEVITRGVNVVSLSFKRLRETIRDIRQYRQLFKFLLAFLIYNDGIGTIIGVAAIYGAELGLGSIELILALLLVQFVGIPYSIIFGRLPTQGDKRRSVYLAFVVFNMIALPFFGIYAAHNLPASVVGAPPEPFVATGQAAGQGLYQLPTQLVQLEGDWQFTTIPAERLGNKEVNRYASASVPGAYYDFAFNGQRVTLTYSTAPDNGIWAIEMDGKPLLDTESGKPLTIDAYSPTVRYEVTDTLSAADAGEHHLRVIDTPEKNPQSSGNAISLATIEVLPGMRESNLGTILGSILAIELVGLALSFLLGGLLFTKLVKSLDTKRTIFLALVVYAVIAVWGYFLNSVIEFWYLAWMVAIVQGGSQALSRSLYAGMSPASKSGEFFGLFGVMEKFSTLLGPLIFGIVGSMTGSSRPAVMSLVVFFIIGGILLTRVNIDEGKRVAQEEDAEYLTQKGQA
jgi:UMF1 family MFS transporter